MSGPPERAAPAGDLDAIVGRVMWRLMPLIMIGYFFAFFDRINIGFAKAQLQADLHLSNTAYGVGASLFVVGYVLFEVPSNLMLYRVGSRRWLARIMISWGIATAAMMLVRSATSFYVLRFCIGALEAGFAPGVLYYLTLWFPPSHRGRANSLLFVASASSGIVGAPIAGLILGGANGLLGLVGWKWLFLFGGLPTILLGLVVLAFLDSRPEDARWLAAEDRARLRQALGEAPVAGRGHSLRTAIAVPGFWLLAVVYFLIQMASYGLNFWGPDLIRTATGGSAERVGLLAAIPYLCGAVSMLILARLSDATGERRQALIFCLVVAATGFVGAGLFSHHGVLLVVALAVLGTGVVAAVPSFWALPPRLLAGAGAASGIALVNTVGQLGGVFSPIVIGWTKDACGSTTPALYLLAGLSVLCALLLLCFAPTGLRVNDEAARSVSRN